MARDAEPFRIGRLHGRVETAPKDDACDDTNTQYQHPASFITTDHRNTLCLILNLK
jgi:hypothetical protein